METPELDDMQCIEVIVNSVDDSLEEQFSSPKSSPKRHIKRKNLDARESASKKARSEDSNMGSPYGDSSDENSKNRARKAKHASKPKKSNSDVDPVELKNILEGMDDEIDNVLEETAEKNRLTAANVKNILRHVITNEYVLAMVRNTMKAENNEGDELEEAVFEPKLTRSKVKELREKQYMLPWPMSTPVKQAEPETKALLEEEFPDESSSDEDYKPNEEECPSEEDDAINSPKSGDLISSISEKSVVSVSKPEEDPDDRLVIALPEPEPEPISESVDNEADKISLRTRSKLPLNDTPLEAIEASFIAPDITEDMYDTQCDNKEWLKFLQDLCQPGDNAEDGKPDEEHDDEEDPEYNALEDEDIMDESDFQRGKISRKELDELMAEIYEFDESLFHEIEDFEEDEEETEVVVREATPVPKVNAVENTRTEWMINEERLQLEEQMRMYVQLLTQSYLLSFGLPHLNFINVTSHVFLNELKFFASNSSTTNEKSAFYAHNLDGALDIVKEYEANKNRIHVRPKTCTKGNHKGIPNHHAKKTMLSSKVFIYPELLPVRSFFKYTENKKALFSPAEDNLIAIGLEEFSYSQVPSPVYYIHEYLVPCKTEDQIKVRIKNCKTKASVENPIKYYLTYKQAPPMPRSVKIFDPDNVKPPKDYPPDILPNWMRTMLSPVSSATPILPKSTEPVVSTNTIGKCPPKRSYRKLLPRNVHFSPLKQISPILKKYNQKRLMPSSSVNNSTVVPRKSVHFSKRIVIKPYSSPNSDNVSEQVINEELIEKDNLLTNVSDISEEMENANTDATVINETDGTYAVNGEISKISECVPDLGINDCESHVELDECEEEIIDDEPESSIQHDSTLANNVINKKHSANKKKNKQQRDLESSLALLQPHLIENDPKKEERENLFVNSFLLRAMEALKEDTDRCERFFKIICKCQHSAQSPVKLFFEVKEILKDFPALADDFVGFLNPEQAKKCGKYKEYLLLTKIRAFIRKVEVHFQNQPQHLLKILRTLAQCKQQSSITSSEVLGILQPLLKNQSHLIEELINLLPDLAPCETLMTDFEDVTIPNSDDDNSSVSCEEIVIPEVPDAYGGKDCPCECHTSSTEIKVLNKIRHCVKCGVKFMDGRVYIQTGKVLKPAQVVYQHAPPEPVPIVNSDAKTTTKNKQSSSLPNIKNSVASDQSSKQEVSPVKKDTVKTPIPNPTPVSIPAPTSASIQPPIVSADQPVPSSSNLPCDVIEDTVFPSLSVESKKSVPPDFSHLKDVIGPTNDKDGNPSEKSSLSDNPAEVSSTVEQLNQSTKAANQNIKWTREEEKLIIYNCQRFGITDKAFEASSAALKSRTLEEIQGRFMHLMEILAQEFNVQ